MFFRINKFVVYRLENLIINILLSTNNNKCTFVQINSSKMSFIIMKFFKMIAFVGKVLYGFLAKMGIFLIFSSLLNCSLIYILYKSKKVLCEVKYFTYKHFLCVCLFALANNFISFLFGYYLLRLPSYDSFILAIQTFNLTIFISCFIIIIFKSYLHWCKEINGNDCRTVELKGHKFSNEGSKGIFVKLYVADVTTIILVDNEGRFEVLKPMILYNYNSMSLYKLYFYVWLSMYLKACITFSTKIIGDQITKKFDHAFLLSIDERICTHLEVILLNYYNIK